MKARRPATTPVLVPDPSCSFVIDASHPIRNDDALFLHSHDVRFLLGKTNLGSLGSVVRTTSESADNLRSIQRELLERYLPLFQKALERLPMRFGTVVFNKR